MRVDLALKKAGLWVKKCEGTYCTDCMETHEHDARFDRE